VFVLVACRHWPTRFRTAALSDALANRLKACFEFMELFRARGAGQSPNVLKYIGTKVEQFKGAWREFGGPRLDLLSFLKTSSAAEFLAFQPTAGYRP